MKVPSLFTFLLASATLTAAEPDKDGFVPLFDGKSLAGWVNVNCAPETWTVQDGIIHCDGVPTGALRTERQYENFILELEWRHLKVGGNAGVFVWASPLSAQGQPFLRAIEVQVLDHGYGKSDWYTTHGDVFPIHGSDMTPLSPNKGKRSFPKELHGKGSPEWNHYRISCQDGSLRLSVNGHEVSGGDHCTWRKGYLGLESEGGVVDWRNIRIKELPSTNAAAADTAPLAQSSTVLYDGRTLRGWKAAEGWKPSDWVLDASAEAAPLRCEKNLPSECLLQFDLKWTGPTPSKFPIKIDGKDLPFSLPDGAKRWHRILLTQKNGVLSAEIDGTPSPQQEPAPAAGKAFELAPETQLSFASIYLTDSAAKQKQ